MTIGDTRDRVDQLIAERNLYRRELELYQQLFDALVKVHHDNGSIRWRYIKSSDADMAVKRVLRLRAQKQ